MFLIERICKLVEMLVVL